MDGNGVIFEATRTALGRTTQECERSRCGREQGFKRVERRTLMGMAHLFLLRPARVSLISDWSCEEAEGWADPNKDPLHRGRAYIVSDIAERVSPSHHCIFVSEGIASILAGGLYIGIGNGARSVVSLGF